MLSMEALRCVAIKDLLQPGACCNLIRNTFGIQALYSACFYIYLFFNVSFYNNDSGTLHAILKYFLNFDVQSLS